MAESVSSNFTPLTSQERLLRLDYDASLPYFSPYEWQNQGYKHILKYDYTEASQALDISHSNIAIRGASSAISTRILPVHVDQPQQSSEVSWYLYEDPGLESNLLAQQLREEAVTTYTDFLGALPILRAEGLVIVELAIDPAELALGHEQ